MSFLSRLKEKLWGQRWGGVGGLDMNLEWSGTNNFGCWTFFAEYVGTLCKWSPALILLLCANLPSKISSFYQGNPNHQLNCVSFLQQWILVLPSAYLIFDYMNRLCVSTSSSQFSRLLDLVTSTPPTCQKGLDLFIIWFVTAERTWSCAAWALKYNSILQIFCIFLFLAGSSLFGTLLSQVIHIHVSSVYLEPSWQARY